LNRPAFSQAAAGHKQGNAKAKHKARGGDAVAAQQVCRCHAQQEFEIERIVKGIGYGAHGRLPELRANDAADP